MQKIAILTSILVLTACSGGHHGGHGSTPVTPSDKPFVPMTDTVGESNAVLTDMISNSETQVVTYVANKLGNDAESVGLTNSTRGATTRGAFVPSHTTTDTLNYDKAQELIELSMWLANDTTTHDDIVDLFNKSKADQNKIKSALKLLDDMYCYVGGNADETANRILARRAEHKFDNALNDVKQHAEILTLNGATLYTINHQLTTFKFNVDKTGKIKSIEYPDAANINATSGENATDIVVGPIARITDKYGNDTNAFATWEAEEDDEDPNYIIKSTYPTEYISYAKQLGLKYSDFGILSTDIRKAKVERINKNDPTDVTDITDDPELQEAMKMWGAIAEPFAGGYTEKRVLDNRMTELASGGEIVFTGTAVADVRYRDEYAGQENTSKPSGYEGVDVPLTSEPMRDTSATLTFNQTGTQTLHANFTDWYDIKAIKDADGKNQLVVLNPDKPVVVNGRDYKPVYNPVTDGVAASNKVANGEYSEHYDMTMFTGYYGDNNNPTEGVVLVDYQYQPKITDENGVNTNGNIGVTIGFGGTRQ